MARPSIPVDVVGNTSQLRKQIEELSKTPLIVNVQTAGKGKGVAGLAGAAGSVTEINAGLAAGASAASSFNRPLGKINGNLSEIDKSLGAANARVIAFGASASAIFAVQNAVQGLFTSFVNTEKQLASINTVLNLDKKGLKSFGKDLYKTAGQTGQSFDTASEAALEFSRQGLGVEETANRTRQALILSRLSGLDAASSVDAITASINSYKKEGLSASQIVNKLANVDAGFAVSSGDLAEALSRVGSSASDAGVSFDELIALVTSAQQTTARGGAVIGNSLKTIFTRLGRSQTREMLSGLGVSLVDEQGNEKNQIALLKDLAGVYGTLGTEQKNAVAEQVGGVFQLNILKAALSDLGKSYSVYDRALNTSLGTTDQAEKRNAQLNKTLSGLGTETMANVQSAASTVGEGLFAPAAKNVLNITNAIAQSVNTSDSASIGSQLGQGIINGLGSFLSGPGLAVVGAVLAKLFGDFAKYGATAAQSLLGLDAAAKNQSAIQQSISGYLQKNAGLYSSIVSGQTSATSAAKQYLQVINQQTAALQQQSAIVKSVSQAVVASVGGRPTGPAAIPSGRAKAKFSGFVPNFGSQRDFYQQVENIGASQHKGGYKAGILKSVTLHDGLGNSERAFMTSREKKTTWTNSAGYKATMIEPPNGFGPNTMTASAGFIPNFARPNPEAFINSIRANAPTLPSPSQSPSQWREIQNQYPGSILDKQRNVLTNRNGQIIYNPNIPSDEQWADYLKNARLSDQEKELVRSVKVKTSDIINQLGLISNKPNGVSLVYAAEAAPSIKSAQIRYPEGKEYAEVFQGSVMTSGIDRKAMVGSLSQINPTKRMEDAITNLSNDISAQLGLKTKLGTKDIPNMGSVTSAVGTAFEQALINYVQRQTVQAKNKGVDFGDPGFIKNIFHNIPGTYEAKENVGGKLVQDVVKKYLNDIRKNEQLEQQYQKQKASAGSAEGAAVGAAKRLNKAGSIKTELRRAAIRNLSKVSVFEKFYTAKGKQRVGSMGDVAPEEKSAYEAALSAEMQRLKTGVSSGFIPNFAAPLVRAVDDKELKMMLSKFSKGWAFQNQSYDTSAMNYFGGAGTYMWDALSRPGEKMSDRQAYKQNVGRARNWASSRQQSSWMVRYNRNKLKNSELLPDMETGGASVYGLPLTQDQIVWPIKQVGGPGKINPQDIPAFLSGQINDAIKRESQAGIPKNQIYLAQEKALMGANPMGIGVFNKLQEPTRQSRKNAMFSKGFARGFIPNFASEDDTTPGLASIIQSLGLAAVYSATQRSQISSSIKEEGKKEIRARQESRKQLAIESKKQEFEQRRATVIQKSQTLRTLRDKGLMGQTYFEGERKKLATQLKLIRNDFKSATAAINSSFERLAVRTDRLVDEGKIGTGTGAKVKGFAKSFGTPSGLYALSSIAPIIGETIAGELGKETVGGRTVSAAAQGVAWAATGMSIAGPWGAAAGGIIGAFQTYNEYIKATNSLVSQTSKDAEVASANASRTADMAQTVGTSISDYYQTVNDQGAGSVKAQKQQQKILSDLTKFGSQNTKTLTKAFLEGGDIYGELEKVTSTQASESDKKAAIDTIERSSSEIRNAQANAITAGWNALTGNVPKPNDRQIKDIGDAYRRLRFGDAAGKKLFDEVNNVGGYKKISHALDNSRNALREFKDAVKGAYGSENLDISGALKTAESMVQIDGQYIRDDVKNAAQQYLDAFNKEMEDAWNDFGKKSGMTKEDFRTTFGGLFQNPETYQKIIQQGIGIPLADARKAMQMQDETFKEFKKDPLAQQIRRSIDDIKSQKGLSGIDLMQKSFSSRLNGMVDKANKLQEVFGEYTKAAFPEVFAGIEEEQKKQEKATKRIEAARFLKSFGIEPPPDLMQQIMQDSLTAMADVMTDIGLDPSQLSKEVRARMEENVRAQTMQGLGYKPSEVEQLAKDYQTSQYMANVREFANKQRVANKQQPYSAEEFALLGEKEKADLKAKYDQAVNERMGSEDYVKGQIDELLSLGDNGLTPEEQKRIKAAKEDYANNANILENVKSKMDQNYGMTASQAIASTARELYPSVAAERQANAKYDASGKPLPVEKGPMERQLDYLGGLLKQPGAENLGYADIQAKMADYIIAQRMLGEKYPAGTAQPTMPLPTTVPITNNAVNAPVPTVPFVQPNASNVPQIQPWMTGGNAVAPVVMPQPQASAAPAVQQTSQNFSQLNGDIQQASQAFANLNNNMPNANNFTNPNTIPTQMQPGAGNAAGQQNIQLSLNGKLPEPKLEIANIQIDVSSLDNMQALLTQINEKIKQPASDLGQRILALEGAIKALEIKTRNV